LKKKNIQNNAATITSSAASVWCNITR